MIKKSSLANLRNHEATRIGKLKGRHMPVAEERRFAQHLVNRPSYRKNLCRQADEGKLHPGLQTYFWDRAYGKSTDKLEVVEPDVKIIWSTREDPPKTDDDPAES